MSYFDLFYALVAITVLLARLVYVKQAQGEPVVIPSGQAVSPLRPDPLTSS
jgi:hypothetical protein